MILEYMTILSCEIAGNDQLKCTSLFIDSPKCFSDKNNRGRGRSPKIPVSLTYKVSTQSSWLDLGNDFQAASRSSCCKVYLSISDDPLHLMRKHGIYDRPPGHIR